ncbi:hypothetical protein L210DRAFT_985816 [Boletus edulis BED1]|uniref:Uncharacterized protein n=1 Tax=Boletus edulis BED1 TaxID=1328754 RepID=A0AAD4BK47_BOLED|nr:hypothetical protein L210DRAFT_985816 [Boletus edulis BED1]
MVTTCTANKQAHPGLVDLGTENSQGRVPRSGGRSRQSKIAAVSKIAEFEWEAQTEQLEWSTQARQPPGPNVSKRPRAAASTASQSVSTIINEQLNIQTQGDENEDTNAAVEIGQARGGTGEANASTACIVETNDKPGDVPICQTRNVEEGADENNVQSEPRDGVQHEAKCKEERNKRRRGRKRWAEDEDSEGEEEGGGNSEKSRRVSKKLKGDEEDARRKNGMTNEIRNKAGHEGQSAEECRMDGRNRTSTGGTELGGDDAVDEHGEARADKRWREWKRLGKRRADDVEEEGEDGINEPRRVSKKWRGDGVITDINKDPDRGDTRMGDEEEQDRKRAKRKDMSALGLGASRNTKFARFIPRSMHPLSAIFHRPVKKTTPKSLLSDTSHPSKHQQSGFLPNWKNDKLRSMSTGRKALDETESPAKPRTSSMGNGYISKLYGGLVDDYDSQDDAPPPAQPRGRSIVQRSDTPPPWHSGLSSFDVLCAFTSTLEAENTQSQAEIDSEAGQGDSNDADKTEDTSDEDPHIGSKEFLPPQLTKITRPRVPHDDEATHEEAAGSNSRKPKSTTGTTGHLNTPPSRDNEEGQVIPPLKTLSHSSTRVKESQPVDNGDMARRNVSPQIPPTEKEQSRASSSKVAAGTPNAGTSRAASHSPNTIGGMPSNPAVPIAMSSRPIKLTKISKHVTQPSHQDVQPEHADGNPQHEHANGDVQPGHADGDVQPEHADGDAPSEHADGSAQPKCDEIQVGRRKKQKYHNEHLPGYPASYWKFRDNVLPRWYTYVTCLDDPWDLLHPVHVELAQRLWDKYVKVPHTVALVDEPVFALLKQRTSEWRSQIAKKAILAVHWLQST